MKKSILISLITASLLQAEFIGNDNFNVVWDSSQNLLWQDDSYENIVYNDTTNYYHSTPNDKLQEWQGAVDYCQNLNFAGFNDWVLPDKDTLNSIAISNSLDNILPILRTLSIESAFINNTLKGDANFWSSISNNSSATEAWNVGFTYGKIYSGNKDNSYYVRCVREVKESFETSTFASLTTLSSNETEPIVEPTIEPISTTTTTNSDCEVAKYTSKLKPTNSCEFASNYSKNELSIQLNMIISDDFGITKTSILNQCKISDSDIASIKYIDRETLSIIPLEEGKITLTCQDDDYIARENICIGDSEFCSKDSVDTALIVVGKGSGSDDLQEAFEYLGNQVYKFLYSQGFSHEEITYFNSFGNQELFGKSVVDSSSYSFEDIESVINDAPISESPLVLYLIDHGTKGGALILDSDKKLYASQLKITLDSFQEKTKRDVIVIVDSCYSGAFVDILKDNNRVIISSGKADELVSMSISGLSLTNYFIKNLQDGKSLRESFESAKETYTSRVNNIPQYDFTDNTLADYKFGQISANAKVISDYTRDTILTTPQTKKIFLEVEKTNLIGIDKSEAYAVITPPQIVEAKNDTDVIKIESEKVELTYDGDNEFYTDYSFSKNGEYLIEFMIIDSANDSYLSDNIKVLVTGGTTTSTVSLNIKSGWNLVALPTNENISTSKFENYKSIWTFENNTWANPTTLNYGLGFWINSNIDKSYEFSGSSYSPNLNSLSGWNLLGTGENISINELSEFSSVWIYSDKWYSKSEISLIQTGEGFWVK